MHNKFVENITRIVKDDDTIIGLLIGGSWITNEMDEFSDLDFIIVTKERISNELNTMVAYANKFGNLINSFTGEHVGEPRLLICMYDNPLLHVDLKFITSDELKIRVEDPAILFDRTGEIEVTINTTKSNWPELDYQWIEDRFWTWIHYTALKLGRGEYFEAYDFLSFLRITVLSPLLQIKNNNLPKGNRKVEFNLAEDDLEKLKSTTASYSAKEIFTAIDNSIKMYRELREELFSSDIVLHETTEEKCVNYYNQMKERSNLW